ncbi:hypothetical protein QYE76_011858 [Lolium multiflorum]|uniref:RNase H type-1 domain-containing protein n=1 Tax=Lolium multiflorum TaxID=4521 RepID=A0AAD8X3D6_LOLMU|nr:hypothetical protein QYE76_011858 [Lolium multiflorum]
MITTASNHTAANDDACGDLAATAIPLHLQKKNRDNGGSSNNNKRKNPSDDQKGGGSDMVDIGIPNGPAKDGTRGLLKARDSKNKKIQVKEAEEAAVVVAEPAGAISALTRSLLPKPAALPKRGYKHARKHRPRGKGGKGKNKDKDEESSEAMDEDDASPDPKEGSAANKSNPFVKKSVGAYHTFLGTLTVRAKKSALRILNATVPAVPQYIKWSEKPCTFDRTDHPTIIPKECYALAVSPRIDGYDFSKCLMDGGASLNIMYLETLERMNLTKEQLKHSTAEFHGVVPELLPHHLRRPTYHKFHARACYIYNKLKILGPNGMITVSGDYKKARDCEEGEAAFAESVISGEELQGYRAAVDPSEMQTTKKQISEQKTSFKAVIDTKKLDLIEGSRKLRHYFQEHPMTGVSKAPLSTIVNNSDATGRVAKWGIELSTFDINYGARTAIKSQVLADFFTDWTEAPEGTPVPEPEAWVMHFDRSKQHQGSGGGVTLKSPTGEELQYVLQIHFEATNNMAEYEALLHGLRIAKEIGIKHFICCGDSDLVAQQVVGTWNARNSIMADYRDEVDEIAKCFLGYEVKYIQRDDVVGILYGYINDMAKIRSNPVKLSIVPIGGIHIFIGETVDSDGNALPRDALHQDEADPLQVEAPGNNVAPDLPKRRRQRRPGQEEAGNPEESILGNLSANSDDASSIGAEEYNRLTKELAIGEEDDGASSMNTEEFNRKLEELGGGEQAEVESAQPMQVLATVAPLDQPEMEDEASNSSPGPSNVRPPLGPRPRKDVLSPEEMVEQARMDLVAKSDILNKPITPEEAADPEALEAKRQEMLATAQKFAKTAAMLEERTLAANFVDYSLKKDREVDEMMATAKGLRKEWEKRLAAQQAEADRIAREAIPPRRITFATPTTAARNPKG